jgi:peptidyl-prolyl cis-trans isomerase D
MQQPFVEAVFALKQGEISDPVRSRFGFHIIQVTAIRNLPFDEVRDDIVTQLRKQALGLEFSEKAGKFSNMVFNESPDSLQPVAEAFGLEIRQTGWIDRGSDILDGELHNKQLVASLFGNDALVKHYNTKALEVGLNTWVSARVLEHEAARRVPLEDARGSIEAQLRRKKAMDMAKEESEAVLAASDQESDKAWSEARTFQRATADLPFRAARAVFAARWAAGQATRVAVELPDDAYVIYQIDEVMRPSIPDDAPILASISEQYGGMLAQSDFAAFRAFIRDRYKVVVKQDLGQAAERGQE